MAPNTMGDGTGCDNMTGIIVRLDGFLPAATNEISETSTGSIKRPLPDDSLTDETQIDRSNGKSNHSRFFINIYSFYPFLGGEKSKRQRVDEEEAVKE